MYMYMYKNDSVVLLRMGKCFKVVDKIKTYIVAGVVLPLLISQYFTQIHFRNIMEICVR